MKSKSGANPRLETWLGLLAIAGAALALRLWHIEDRPMHTDEAVHAAILGQMLQGGSYRYNPDDFHGPTLYFGAYPILTALGLHGLPDLQAWPLRMISALIGSATILSLGFWALEFSTTVLWSTGAFIALSAPFVYYQRYFIHEGLFVLLSLLFAAACWFFAHRVTVTNGIYLGLVAGLLFATKETATLVVTATLAAGILTWISQPVSIEKIARHLDRKRLAVALLSAASLFLFVFALFYSSMGAHAHGLIDAVSSILRFTHRAQGEGHAKPWWTYLNWMFAPNFQTLPWSGWIIALLSCIGGAVHWPRLLVRYLVFYTVTTLAIYSLIPYKTPWLELNILAPACLLAGLGVAVLIKKLSRNFFVLIPLVAILPLLGMETDRLCFKEPIDVRNPLAYSPTVPDIENLVRAVDQIASRSPSASIQVVSRDYWPLPWYLRHHLHVGYWNEIPAHLDGDIVITSPEQMVECQARLGAGWTAQYFGLRPEVLAVLLSREAKP